MRRLKKRLFGYSPQEVDAYLAELNQQRQELAQTQNQMYINEFTQIEAELARYRQDEQQSIDYFQGELAVHDDIVQTAHERNQALKTMARDKLLRYEEKLAERKLLLQNVYEHIRQLQTILNGIETQQSSFPLAEDSDGKQTI